MAFICLFLSQYVLRLACDVTLHDFCNEVLAVITVITHFRAKVPMKLSAPGKLLSK